MKAIIALIFLLGIGSFVYYSNLPTNKTQNNLDVSDEKADKKASFIIFTNGTLRDFSQNQYHNRSKDVYLTSENPTQIIIKRAGVTWEDFFRTLPSPMKLTKDCLYTGTGQVFCTDSERSLKFYVNGKIDKELLSREIKNGDKALITFGKDNELQIQEQLKLLE